VPGLKSFVQNGMRDAALALPVVGFGFVRAEFGLAGIGRS
jgi:hypothetical protein